MYVWPLNAALALDLLLAIFVVCIIVLLNYDDKATFNKLTMWPYFFMVGYCVLDAVQLSFMQFNPDNYFFYTISTCILKVSILSLAINVQVYEWLDASLVIWYQRNLDITTIGVARQAF